MPVPGTGQLLAVHGGWRVLANGLVRSSRPLHFARPVCPARRLWRSMRVARFDHWGDVDLWVAATAREQRGIVADAKAGDTPMDVGPTRTIRQFVGRRFGWRE